MKIDDQIRNAIVRDVKRETNVDVTTKFVDETLHKYYKAISQCIECKESVDMIKIGRFQFNETKYLKKQFLSLAKDTLTPNEIEMFIADDSYIDWLKEHHYYIFKTYYG